MSDKSILEHISALLTEEQELRANTAEAEACSQRVRHLEEQLDQCWDLLRLRRAKREFGADPDTAAVRDVGTVKRYVG